MNATLYGLLAVYLLPAHEAGAADAEAIEAGAAEAAAADAGAMEAAAADGGAADGDAAGAVVAAELHAAASAATNPIATTVRVAFLVPLNTSPPRESP